MNTQPQTQPQQTGMAIVPPPQVVTDIQAKAWVSLAGQKNTVTYELSLRELALQGILINVPDAEIAAKLKIYRATHLSMVEYRKEFTGMISSFLIEPLTAYEKRSDPKENAAYLQLATRELSLRVAAEQLRQANERKDKEKANYRLFIMNEYERIGLDLKTRMYNEIKSAIKGGITDRAAISATLASMRPVETGIFTAVLITPADRDAIHRSIPMIPNYTRVLEDMTAEMNRLMDIPPVEVQQAIEFTMVEAAAEVADNTHMNTIIAHQEVAVISKPHIKRNLEVVPENTNDWATTIMTTFMNNNLFRYVRVKDIAKLTIAQMAKAIGDFSTENGEELDGIAYKEIVK